MHVTSICVTVGDNGNSPKHFILYNENQIQKIYENQIQISISSFVDISLCVTNEA